MLINWILGNEQNSKRSAALWNTIGGGLNAGQAAIILIFISHKLGIVTAGIVTIAYAIANLFLAVCKYGIRNYQVTDVKESFIFTDYFYGRIVTTIITTIILLFYLVYCYYFGGYSLSKVIIIFEVTVLKLIDAFEDVYLGRYQQVGRLDVAAKIMAVRLMISTAFICILVLVGSGLYIALLAGIVVSVILDVYFIRNTFIIANTHIAAVKWNKVGTLLKIGVSLCIGITLSIYIGNVPKYMIDTYMNEEVQAVFGYIMMPVFVITLLNQFIYQPMIKDLGDLWEQKNYNKFKKNVIRQALIVIALTIVILIAGILIGLPILSVMYNADLSAYKMEFALLLLGGGFYALAYYLNVPITTIRKQNYIAVGYAIAAVLSFVFGKYLVISLGMMGAAILYLSVNGLLVLIYTVVLVVGVRKNIL